ncbi:hypothetical protein [Streptomyces sp. G1]|uniref:hypothetical protein n=1 Tax=Streptomyces sp. G1 TaxID=361572 RepID=UPI00202FAE12|nr:hypothetical protein [Streptomyces sp. G1]MCM1972327.1 hypothetical protein [Streptomyces sp. G1]
MPPAWSCRVPDVIDALVDRFRTSAEFDGVTVWDGPEVSKATPQEVLTVAYTGDENDNDVESTSLPEGLASQPDRETFTVRCAIAVLKGNTGMRAVRRRAYELYSAAGMILASDPRLGGTVLRARLGSHTFRHVQTDRGAQALLVFGIDCDAYTRR